MVPVTTRTIWIATIAVVLLFDVANQVSAQLPPQEESVGDNNENNNTAGEIIENDDEDSQQADKNDDTCLLCLDGSNPVASDVVFESVFGVPSNPTCNDVIATAATMEDSDETCEDLQLAAFQGGCCPRSSFFNTPSSFDRCPLCPEGEGPGFLPFKEIPGSSTTSTGTEATTPATCSDLRRNTDSWKL
ncbi:MAG: hypothetical protein SGARI_003849 [Bacillariaceae sp.]